MVFSINEIEKKNMLLSIETPSSSKLPSPKNVIVWCQSYGNIEILLFIKKISFSDILFWNMSRIFSPINFILSVPLTTLCTDGIGKSVCFFNWYGIVSLNWKISSKFEELYLCYWVETQPSLSRSSSKFNIFSLYTVHRHHIMQSVYFII